MDDIIGHYVEIGAISIEGVDESGEILFSVTEDAKELAPELWEAHREHIDKTLIDLYQKGLIEIEYNEELEAGVKLSPEGIKAAESHGLRFLDEQ